MPASDLIKRAEVTNPNESAAAGELAAALAMPRALRAAPAPLGSAAPTR